MSAFAKKVRACDKFASPVGLNFEGSKNHETIGGGSVSVLLRFLMILYLCIKLIAVFGYKDP